MLQRELARRVIARGEMTARRLRALQCECGIGDYRVERALQRGHVVRRYIKHMLWSEVIAQGPDIGDDHRLA